MSVTSRSAIYARQLAKLPQTVAAAIQNRPYGWGEYLEQIDSWQTENYIVRRGAQNLAVECLLHLQPDRNAPLYVNLGGYTTPAMLYGPLGRTVWERGLNSIMVSLPGHGHTDLPPMRYRSYRESARIVYEAIDQARRQYGLTGEMRVLGHSHGGGMAQGLAAEFGDEISRYYILAGVGGPEWTRLVGIFTRGLEDIKHGRLFTDNVADGWQRLSGFVGDGYVIIPPPWELAGWRAELIRPFTRSLHGESLQNLYSVLVDTLLGSAEQLEECLTIISTLEAPTIILAGKADGVITHGVIESQAYAAAKPGQTSAPVFRSQTTHAGFLAAAGRSYVADMVAMSDDTLAEASTRHYLAA